MTQIGPKIPFLIFFTQFWRTRTHTSREITKKQVLGPATSHTFFHKSLSVNNLILTSKICFLLISLRILHTERLTKTEPFRWAWISRLHGSCFPLWLRYRNKNLFFSLLPGIWLCEANALGKYSVEISCLEWIINRKSWCR